jgi:hypothetical protein
MPATLSPSATASPARNIRRTRLPNGLLVLTESIPHVRSVSMGVWIDSGSRDESKAPHRAQPTSSPARSTRLEATWTPSLAKRPSASISKY